MIDMHPSLFVCATTCSTVAMIYRFWQLARALNGRITADERFAVAHRLAPAELRLFEQMARFDQRHCLDVYQTLLRAGYNDPALLRAALLHDCGKVDEQGQPIPLIYYGMFVVLLRFAPAVYTWAGHHQRGLLRPFAIHAAHEQRAALLAAQAGSAPEVISILGDYAARRITPATLALRWADERN